MTNPVNITVMTVAVAFLIMGLGALYRPLWVSRQFGIHELSRAARSEIRGVYGGFGIFLSFLLWSAVLNPDLRSGICLTVATALVGMAAGRGISMLVDRGIDRAPACYLVAEMVLGSAMFLVS